MLKRDTEYVRWYPLRWRPLEPMELNPKWRPKYSNDPKYLAIYIHFPFCYSFCDFCPYLKERYDPYRSNTWLESINRHIALLSEKGFFDERLIRCIYWGGGTPSLISIKHVEKVMKTLARFVDLSKIVEISFEASPEPHIVDYLLALRDTVGITRCSLGVQSFDQALLCQLGSNAKNLNFENEAYRLKEKMIVSIDLLYNCPNQTLKDFETDLKKAIDLGVDQISVYEIILTPNEKLWNRLSSKEKHINGSSKMLDTAFNMLPSVGLNPVLVSDFARYNRYSVYQVEHWKSPQIEVLGLGPGAISYFGGFQYANLAILDAYIKSLDQDRLPLLCGYKIDSNEELCRNIVLGFKALEIDRNKLIQLFPNNNYEVDQGFNICMEYGLIENINTIYKLTSKGIWYVDNVSKFFYSSNMRNSYTPCEMHLIEWTKSWIKNINYEV